MISIITPTFNRAHTLTRLFKSIENQSNSNYEWIIIDDGSIDETPRIVSAFIEKIKSVKYRRQENLGKPAALNHAIDLASGDWIFIVDSDDAIEENAIEEIELQTGILDKSFNGICFRKSFFTGELVGTTPRTDSEWIETNPNNAASLFKGDLAYIFRKDSLKTNKFPIHKNEKFTPELYIWNKISDKGRIRFFTKKSIYKCEYLPDGLSKTFKKQLKENPVGFALYYKDQIKRERNFWKKTKNIARLIQCTLYKKLR